jgi:hypothetical protein
VFNSGLRYPSRSAKALRRLIPASGSSSKEGKARVARVEKLVGVKLVGAQPLRTASARREGLARLRADKA